MTAITIAGEQIARGESKFIQLPIAKLYTDSDMAMPVFIQRGKKAGPTLFISAAIHGDELNGVEIVRRLIKSKALSKLSGTLIAVPIVNVYGVLQHSRYLPDRRDLNRSFPGSERSSLAGRVANTFLSEIVAQCDYGIDLHTGAIHRSNLPQIRADLSDPETLSLAESFGVPVLLNSSLRDGSLREAATKSKCKMLLYEAGEALRFDELSIRVGLKGVMNVMSELKMIPKRRTKKLKTQPFVAHSSVWLRANASGFVRDFKQLGDAVEIGDALAEIGSPFGDVLSVLKARKRGVIIGKQNIPLVHEGDAMFHIAFFQEDEEEVVEHIDLMHGFFEEYPVLE
jgi:predicted deacylase